MGLPRASPEGASRGAVSFLCHWSVRLLCPGVTRRTALRSSDFPPAFVLRTSARQALASCPPSPGCESRRSSGRLRRIDYRAPPRVLLRLDSSILVRLYL